MNTITIKFLETNYVLFRTRNLGQQFLEIKKKNDVNQALVSLINDKSREMALSSQKLGYIQ
jgi:hypothetical protein